MSNMSLCLIVLFSVSFFSASCSGHDCGLTGELCSSVHTDSCLF